MRDFFLSKDETVIVNGDIKVTVIDIHGGIDGDNDNDEVTLAIDIPEWMGIGEIGQIGEIESLQDMELVSTG